LITNPLIESRNAFAARHREARISLNGRDWGYRDVGTGEVLLMIPGTLGRSDIFWNQITALSDRLRIVAVSYPDTGDIADWANDMTTLLDRLEIEEASVMGSSLGGYLAQYIAGTTPYRVTRLLAANTLHSAAGFDQRMPYALDLQAVPIAELRAGFGNGLTEWGKAHPEQADLVELLLQEAGGRILEPELRVRLAALKHAPELPTMPLKSASVVTIESDDDPLIPIDMRSAVRARLQPDVVYRFLEGGHYPYVARPEEYTSLLEQVFGLTGTGPDWGLEKVRCR